MSQNKKFVLNIISIAGLIYGIAMIPSVVMAVRYNETGVYRSMIIISAMCIFFGALGHLLLDNELTNVKIRICYMTTILTWLILILLSAIPFYVAGMDYSIIDCIFESTAGWTTTGASAIATESLPAGLKLWRASCNWMGGIGIILLTLTFLPSWQFVGQKLVSTEIRGPGFLMSNITFRKAYRRIILLYTTLTVSQYIILRICGMGRLCSLLTSLSNTSTSGLQHINNGVIIALSTPLKIVITLFSLLGSMNCSVFTLLLVGRFRSAIRNSETKLFFLVILTSTIALTVLQFMANKTQDLLTLFGNILMQVISFCSTAGYIVTECHTWTSGSITLVTIIIFVGACAMSTGGGIKMSRIVIALKSVSANLYGHIHPHSVREMRYNGEVLKRESVHRGNVYIALFMIVYIVGGFLLSLDGTGVYEAFTYSQAMLTNIGTPIMYLQDPGLITTASTFNKSIMTVLMLCGRLEIYPVLIAFSFRFWTSKRGE